MIKAVLFDMDGILFDSENYYTEGMKVWMKRLGYHGDDKALYQLIGKDMSTMYSMLYELLDERVPLDLVKKTNEDYFLKEHPINAKEWMFPGVKEVLQKLNDLGILCAVCSSSDRREIDKALKDMEIDGYFQLVKSVQECALPKPAGDIYVEVCNCFGLKKDECLVYEDSEVGIMAGVNAGIYTIAREDLRFYQDQSKADRIVKDINELYNVVIEMRNEYGRSH